MSDTLTKTDSKMKSLPWFFVASISASVFNYLFHVVIARRAGPEAFAHFSVAWSYLSLFFVTGVMCGYYATLNPIKAEYRRALMIGVQIASLLALALDYVGVAVIVINLQHNLLVGFCLRRKDFTRVNILTLGVATGRIVMLVLMPLSLLNPHGIFTMVYLSFAIMQFAYLFFKPKHPHVDVEKGMDWFGPVILAVIAGIIPQIDILWSANFPGGEAILRMSELSLVSKGVFFLQMILAQYMLPLEQKRAPSLKQVSLMLVGAFAFSVVAGTAATYILPVVLHWTTPVSALDFIRVSMIGMSSSLFYMLIQMLTKVGRLLAPVIAILTLIAQALLQGELGFGLDIYLTVTAAAYVLLSLSLSAYQATRPALR